MILTLLALCGALLVLAFVLLPLTGELAPAAVDAAGPAGDPLVDRREAALSGLAELDFDRALGNLSAADYEQLRSRYREEALGVLRALSIQPGASSGADATDAVAADQPAPAAVAPQPLRPPARLWAGLLVTALLLLAAGAALWQLVGPGASSSRPGPPLDVLHVHAAALVPGTTVALVAHHDGLLRSADGGQTWQAVPGVSGDVLALAAAPVVGSEIYLAGPGQIMRSRDAGLSWQPVPLPPSAAGVSALALAENGSPPLYAYAPGVGLFKSDNIDTWQLVGGGLSGDPAALVLRSGAYGALYAANPGDGVLASGDSGQTWGSASGALNGALPTLAVRALADDPGSGERYAAPDGTVLTGTLYAATDLGLFKSVDGGGSWAQLPLQQPLAAIAVGEQPAPLLLAVDSKSRVWFSRDHGGSWSARQ